MGVYKKTPSTEIFLNSRNPDTTVVRSARAILLNSWSSCKGRKGNALALRADEGRDKLR